MNAKSKGIVLMVAAAVFWSTSGLFVRALETQHAWEMVFWRSIGMIPLMAAYLFWRYGRAAPQSLLALGRAGWLAGAFLASTFFFFLYAVSATTVATALFLMSTSPLWAALLGRLVLGEALALRTLVAIAACAAGVAIMVGDALSFGSILGPLAALCVSLAFAAQIVVIRKAGASVDMAPSVLVAGLLSVVFAWPLVDTAATSGRDILILMAMGVIQLGLGCLLMTLATKYLAAAQVGLIALLETTLGPLWVWIVYTEQPSGPTLLGGGIILAALLANELWAAKRVG
jgi:drug/metabolite transporter (DMT)-like permease